MKVAIRTGLAAVLGVAIVYGCAGPPAQDTPAEAEAESTEPPTYLREASLPEGYPAAGPVGQVQIKQYPSVRLVRARADEHGGPNRLFRPLFNHIKRNEIAMTAPVEMTYEPGGPDASPAVRSMAFIYPSQAMGQVGPDESLEVLDTEPMTVLSIGVRGGYTTKRFAANHQRLDAWLAAQDTYEAAGPPRYLAYNSPFVPGFMKFGEVQVPVRARELAGAAR